MKVTGKAHPWGEETETTGKFFDNQQLSDRFRRIDHPAGAVKTDLAFADVFVADQYRLFL
jgi:hypothetical protein